MAAVALGYNKLLVTWRTIGGTWDLLRLVRNRNSFPDTPDDGTTLINSAVGPSALSPGGYGGGIFGAGIYGGDGSVNPPAPTSYDDSGLKAGFWYYSLFVRDITGGVNHWRRVGDAMGQACSDLGYADYLAQRLPRFLLNDSGEVGGGINSGSALYRYLGIYGLELSRIKGLYDGILFANDPDHVPGPMLPHISKELGFCYEPNIGMRQNRVLLRNAVRLGQLKGTSKGITALASSLTGWGCTQGPLVNLLLNQDDSSADNTIGTWTGSAGVTVTRSTGQSPPGDSAYTSRPGVFSVSAASGTRTVTLGNRIPVTALSSYILSLYLLTTLAGSVTANITWYDQTGSPISTDTQACTTPAAAWQRALLLRAAPATAVFAGLSLSCSTNFFFDAVQLGPSSTAATTVPDSGPNAQNGTLVGSVLPAYVPSPWSGFGNALQFDGVGRGANTSGVDLGTSTGLCVSGVGAAATFCIEAKGRIGSSGASGVIIERANTSGGGGTLQPGIGGGVGATFFVQTRDNGGTYRVVNGTTTALANTNYDVAGTYDGTTLRLYVNGVMEGSLALSGVETPAAGIHTYIGRIDDATTPNPFSGTIDEVRLSKVARYTGASYTPSTTPFTSDSLTLGLWHLDTTDPGYEAARSIDLTLVAPRINQLPNGGFDVSVTGWTPTFATVAQSTTATYDGGLGSAKLVCNTNNSQMTLISDKVSWSPGQQASVSLKYIQGNTFASNNPVPSVAIYFLDAGGSILSPTPTTVVSPSTTNDLNWHTLTINGGLAPANTASVQVLFTASAYVGDTIYIDDVILEKSSVSGPYFDSRENPGDVFWQGTPNNSRSYLYPNYLSKIARLTKVLPDFLPFSAEFQTLVAQP